MHTVPSNSVPLMQFQADILRIPVVRPAVTETTALGAAYLAGLAVGFWKNPQSIAAQWKVDRTFEPQLPASRARELRERWNDAVQRARDWAPPDGVSRKRSAGGPPASRRRRRPASN